MIVAKYSPIAALTNEAIKSLSYRPSITELYLTEAASDSSHALGVSAFAETGSAVVDGMEMEYGVLEDGSCVVLHSEGDVAELAMPDSIAGHPVVAIGPHAFSTCYELQAVQLPDSVSVIYEYAFMNTALRSFAAPSALETIGRNAFYKCAHLERVDLGERVTTIDQSAFQESALKELFVPASVRYMGRDVLKGTAVVFSGPGQTLTISSENTNLLLKNGALYCRIEEGLALVQLLDNVESFEAEPGVVLVGEKAFAGLSQLKSVKLPEGTVRICEAAFRRCKALTAVDLPDSLEVIERRAFWETSLSAIRIPASLKGLGAAALYTGGTIARFFEPTISSIEVAPGNTSFYLEHGILCQRRDDGSSIALLYAGRDSAIAIPHNITAIGPYAFVNVTGVRTLYVHDLIESIDVGGFDFGGAIANVVYENTKEGRTYVVKYPLGESGKRAMKQVFSLGSLDVAVAYLYADNALLTTQDTFMSARGMLERLLDGDLLNEKMEHLFRDRLRVLLPNAVVEFGRNGYLQGIDQLLETGVLNEGNVETALDAAMEAGEIAVLSRLMEIRRTHFGTPLFDFDL